MTTSVSAAEPAGDPDRSTVSAPVAVAAASQTTRNGRLDGIDVSNWQGRIRWWKVARDGVDFVIAKASEGNGYADPSWERNHACASARGLRVTAYHYARPDRRYRDAVREADYFLGRADLRARDLVPALDLEDSGGLSPWALRRWTLDWLQRVEQRLGVKPMIYTSPGFWASYLGDTRRIAQRGYKVVWVAHWGIWRPRVPAGGWNGHGWTFWQWTSRGHVDGIHGYVDRDRFNGTSLMHLTIGHRRRAASARAV